jgi:GNAT superfamily N-acetyltransferase
MLADVAGRAAAATVLVAVAGERIVGTATVKLDQTIGGSGNLDPGQANFRVLAVDPVARGCGVGRRLVGPGSGCSRQRRPGVAVVTH